MDKLMRVECGSLKWKGKCSSVDQAIVSALGDEIPENPASLLRVHDGLIYHYIDFRSALKVAGYTTRKTKRGFKIV